MSHVTDIKLRIRDLDALKEAAAAVGLEMREHQRTFAWWGTFMNDSSAYGAHDPKDFGACVHALGIPGQPGRNGSAGPWEIGVVPAKDGDGYDLLFDTFGSAGQQLLARVGPSADRLRQEYAVAVAMRKAAPLKRQGFTVQREALAGGGVRLRLRKR